MKKPSSLRYIHSKHFSKPIIQESKFAAEKWWKFEKKLTVFSRLLDERVHAALPVVSLWSHSGDVVPAHGFDDVHHGLGLVCVRRYHPGEEVVAGVVAELRRRWGITHLRNLPDRKNEPDYTRHISFIHKETGKVQFLRFRRSLLNPQRFPDWFHSPQLAGCCFD